MATGSNELHTQTADTGSTRQHAAAPAGVVRPAAAVPQVPPTGPTGSPHTQLVVLRGPSGAGKTTVATAVRARLGRGVALVQQDVLRRVILREHDVPGGLNIALIATVCRFSLDAGYHVILEGILTAARYGPMLRRLAADHRGRTSFFYLDVPFDETVHLSGRKVVA